MFDQLTARLTDSLRKLSGEKRITESNIEAALRQVRLALLEADVALPVVKDFISRARTEAVGRQVAKSLAPGQVFIKLVQELLTEAMGTSCESLDLAQSPPAVVMVAGLQGSGKTTTVAKLAHFLKNQKKRVMVTSADVYRPAAIHQLEVLAAQIDVMVHPSSVDRSAVEIAQSALMQARAKGAEVLIIDTAGRMHVDDDLMAEARAIHGAVRPVETLFVVDAMTGQDAVNTAKAFDQALPVSGVILTKADGDSRGGAALSVRQVTGKPIKFLGIGEKVTALEPFHPDRIASRILGMGDVVSLVEEVEQKLDRRQAEKLGRKISGGKKFDLEDFREQLSMVDKLGGVAGLLDKLPGMAALPEEVRGRASDGELVRTKAIINSMTPQERRFPDVIRGSRKKRIAAGSGVQVQDVNRMLKQFQQMQKMMKKVTRKGGMKKMMRGLQGGGPFRGPM